MLEESERAQTLELSVTDTGVGVPPEQQQRLFEEFSQAQASTAQRFGGTGLGLVICKRLALLMGGDVTMESAPGTGTTMRLTVPLPVGDPAAIDQTAALMPGTAADHAPEAEPGAGRARGQPAAAGRGPPGQPHGAHAPAGRDRLLRRHGRRRPGRVREVPQRPLRDSCSPISTCRAWTATSSPARSAATSSRPQRRRTPIVALTANVMQGEPGKVRGRRDGRLRGQADDDPRAGRQAASLAAGARLARRSRFRRPTRTERAWTPRSSTS